MKTALAYATRLGFAVFPVGPDCRKPLCRHGYQDASKEADGVRNLWRNHPDGNLAVACGKFSGVWVLDIDVKTVDGLATLSALEASYEPLPVTWKTRTPSGGLHIWFSYSDRPNRNRVNVRPGLDVRTTGGSVALPPSRKPNGIYEWEVKPSSCELATAPGWLIEVVDPPDPPRPPAPEIQNIERYAAAALLGACRDVAEMGEGSGRNHQLFKSSARLGKLIRDQKLDEETVIEALLAASHDCGLYQEDGQYAVMATIRSGLRRSAA